MMRDPLRELLIRNPVLRQRDAGVVSPLTLVDCPSSAIHDACLALSSAGCSFSSIIAEGVPNRVQLLYLFRLRHGAGWYGLLVQLQDDAISLPSIATVLPAADWHEREVEDLFGVIFEGHPRLGDFVLHDQRWREQLMPMTPGVEVIAEEARPPHSRPWTPQRLVEAPGGFTMPVGPVYSGVAESGLFLLETLGEDVIRAFPRLFYKYRAIEKIVEGQSTADALLRVERCSGTSALAHAWAFAQAVERICGFIVDDDTVALRAFFAELERYRHHVATIREICESTSTLVATSQAAIVEEEVLRLCGELGGHRYLFGVVVPGGIAVRPSPDTLQKALKRLHVIDARLRKLQRLLWYSSSFRDRIEEVGIIAPSAAASHGLVGPLARASAATEDLRATQPYSPYDKCSFQIPSQVEGDGYARLGVLFAEAEQSLVLMGELAGRELFPAPAQTLVPAAGAALGWVEAPRGAAIIFVRVHKNGTIERLRLTTPSFTNWRGFYLATERFAFQDFPIILATLDLSIAENDR